MLGTRWKIKPPLGYEIDWEHPLAQGLQFFAPLWEGSGPAAYDLVTGTPLTMNAGPSWSRAGSSSALAFTGSNECVQATAPHSLRFGLPASIALGFRPLGAPGSTAPLFGTTYTSTATSPWYGVAFQYISGTSVAVEWNMGGASEALTSGAAVTYGQDCVISASVANGEQAIYQNGLQTAAGTATGTLAYGTSPWIQIGATSLFGREANILAYWGAMWDRTLAPAEHAALAANVWQICQPKRTQAPVLYSLSFPESFTAKSGNIPSNYSGNITVQLAGIYTSWSSGGTTFSLTGTIPTGVTLVSQTINSRTSATLVFTTGAGIGPVTISDGTASTTIEVVAPSLSVATTGSIEYGTYTATLTGGVTLWTQLSPTGLFTISGASGVSISSVTVQSNTLATATIAVGNSAGTDIITDTSTGKTATIAVMSPPAGSLQLSGPLLLGAPSSTALFGGKASATIALTLQIDADTVPTGSLATGTTLVGWGTNVSGGVGLAVYYPATNTLTITAYGASGKSQTLTWSTTVQLGIGYHFVISWANGAQVIYQDGVAVASTNFAATTYAYQQVQIGSGASVAVNHQVSNLMIWSAYAASQADAVALMNGTENALQVGGSASAWWPLGGGTVGAQPTLADVWVADASGNGNALTTVSGSLANARYAGVITIQALVTVAPHVTRCGRLAMFGSIAATPTANGIHPHRAVTAVTGTPTVYRNGIAVGIGRPRWFSESLDSPFVAYQLQCGSVDRLAVSNGGTGYTGTPSASWSGGGGSSLVLGTPTTASGVTSYTVTAAGSGYTTGPAVTITDPGGSGTGAVAYAVVVDGTIVGYWISNGGSNYSNPTVAVSGSGSGATAVATQSGGVITAINAVTCGKNYHTPPTVTVAAPSGASGFTGNITAVATAVVSPTGTIVAVLPICAGLLGSGSGYSSGSPPAVTIAAPGSGTTATATAVVSNYIESIPVVSSSNDFTGLPTIVITGAGSGATALPIMTGVLASDVMAYSAPAGWFATALGGAAAAVNTPMTNWTGQAEGPTNGMIGFTATPTMPFGASMGEQPANYQSSNVTTQNRLLAAEQNGAPWAISGTGVLTTGSNGFPVSWTNPTATYVYTSVCDQTAGNGLDSMGVPNPLGQWTIQYDDPHINTSSSSAVWLVAYLSESVLTPVNLSGNGTAAAGTVTRVGNAITAVAVGTAGTGYQGAIAFVTGGGGSGAILTVQCSGGAITGFTVVNGGSNYTSTPTITIYGVLVDGTAVTSVWNVQLPASPTTQQIGLLLNVANPSGTWTIGNPWLVAPIAATGLAATVTRSNALAVDDNALAILKIGSKSIAALRFMDVTGGYGGIDNYIDATDLALGPQVGDATWSSNTTQWVPFAYMRYFNTNPALGSVASGGNGTYNWPASTKIYGTQPWMVSGTDAPFTVTGKLTSGSAVVTGVSSTADVIAGASIAGAGIPAGTTVAGLGTFIFANLTSGSAVVTGISNADMAILQTGMSVSGPYSSAHGGVIPDGTTVSSIGTNQFTLSQNAIATISGSIWIGSGSLLTLSAPATANGSAETLTITNPPYVSLSATDNGYFMGGGVSGAETLAVVELYTGGAPHGLKTGQYGYIFRSSTGYTVANGSYSASGPTGSNALSSFFVTGPTTVVVGFSVNTGAPTGTSPSWLDSATPIEVNWDLEVSIPFSGSCVPYEYAAAMCQQVGCNLWLNFPHASSDSLVQAIAAKVVANIGPTANVYLEFGNENWNGEFPSNGWHSALSVLLGYVTPGTSVFGGHLIAYGQTLPNAAYGSVSLTADHAFSTFETAWTAAGLAASRLKRVHGSWWTSPTTTQYLMEGLQQYGITADDHVAVAPYMNLPTDQSIASAMAPAGSVVSGSGSWPVDAINDLFRYWIAYSQTNWGIWKGHAQYCQGLGQPLYATATTSNGGGASGGSLPTGTYHVGYTFVDSLGRETTMGFSETTFSVTSPAIPTMAMPAWPTWAQSMNVYLTQAGGASGTEVRYATIPLADYGYGNTYPIGAEIPLSAANTGSTPPPTTNLAAANVPQIPTTVCYEGGLQECPAANSLLQSALSQDRWLHASANSAIQGYALACQQGCPTFSGSGAALSMYYQLLNPPSYPDEWTLAVGVQQQPGTGPTTLATVQGSASFDGHSHLQGTSPALAGFQAWFQAVSSPTPPTTSTGRRRWFSGLRKPVMRLGR